MLVALNRGNNSYGPEPAAPGYPVVFNQPEPGALLGFDPYAKPFRFDGGGGSYLGGFWVAPRLTRWITEHQNFN